MRRMAIAVLSLVFCAGAHAFCGFYVAKADASLYNKASQVVLVHNENKTAITMYNDYKGELKEFALVVPVPEVLSREQINVGDKLLVERADAYSAPRLVEYFDSDPCAPKGDWDGVSRGLRQGAAPAAEKKLAKREYGVKIEAQYTVGEYDILILSAKESDGLEAWLVDSGYKMPKGISKALEPYIKQKMKFFVAKVNLKEQAKTGFSYLRPLQFAFESPKFMLPIRLGMANSDGPQDLLIYAITRKGRVETTNYRTVKLPSGQEIPTYIKSKFGDFYKAMFDTAHKKENQKVVFEEYAWNMSWCDPCAADPMTRDELRKLGVFWLADGAPPTSAPNMRKRGRASPPVWNGGGAVEAFITRLHVRYDAEHFPEDLIFQETANSENFQGRYVMRHAWSGPSTCAQAEDYRKSLPARHAAEATTLASLTGWEINAIRKEMGPEEPEVKDGKKWYKNIFK